MTIQRLSKEDRDTLEIELGNSTNGRRRKLWTSFLVSIVGLSLALVFDYWNPGRLTDGVILMSLLITAFGIFNIVFWAMFSRSIRILGSDIDNGVKHVSVLKISGYNFFRRKVILEDGSTLDTFDINFDWKRGDTIYIEKLPGSGFVLRCERNVK